MEITNDMPDSFFEWLNDCPAMWFLIKSDNDSMVYSFIVPEPEEEEE